MSAPAKVVHEPEHRFPALHRHGCQLLPVHRGNAAHGWSDYTLVSRKQTDISLTTAKLDH